LKNEKSEGSFFTDDPSKGRGKKKVSTERKAVRMSAKGIFYTVSRDDSPEIGISSTRLASTPKIGQTRSPDGQSGRDAK
jgi:hypothetical protein